MQQSSLFSLNVTNGRVFIKLINKFPWQPFTADDANGRNGSVRI